MSFNCFIFPGNGRSAKKVMVIGCGRWGTFIAWYLNEIGHRVTLYGRRMSANMRRLMETRENEYLQLGENVELVTNFENIAEADYIIISIAAQNLQEE